MRGATGRPGATCLLAVCGAHLRGQPLHPVLEKLGAVLVEVTRTAAVYRMVALPPSGDVGPRPGLIRLRDGGSAVEVEVYRVQVAALGELLVTIASPLAIGQVLLEDATTVQGFVCESYVDDEAGDITEFGSWRAYLAATARLAVGSPPGKPGDTGVMDVN